MTVLNGGAHLAGPAPRRAFSNPVGCAFGVRLFSLGMHRLTVLFGVEHTGCSTALCATKRRIASPLSRIRGRTRIAQRPRPRLQIGVHQHSLPLKRALLCEPIAGTTTRTSPILVIPLQARHPTPTRLIYSRQPLALCLFTPAILWSIDTRLALRRGNKCSPGSVNPHSRKSIWIEEPFASKGPQN